MPKKEMSTSVLTNCSISSAIPWAAEATSPVLWFFWEQYKSTCKSMQTTINQTTVRSLVCYFEHPEPPLPSWTEHGNAGSFWLTKTTCFSALKVVNERLQLSLSELIYMFLYWRVVGTDSMWASLLVEQTTITLLFWCFKAGSQHFCSVHGNYWCICREIKPLLH